MWWYYLILGLGIPCALYAISALWNWCTRPARPKFIGKHVIVTGGSQGMGLELARILAGPKEGATVTIMARTARKLEEAVALLRSQTGSEAVHYESVDLSDVDATHAAFERAQTEHGPIYGVFCCAGAARPSLFATQDKHSLDFELKADYLTALNSAHAAVRAFEYTRRADETSQSFDFRLQFTSSIVGLIGLAGYATYAASKHAIRGLATCLRQELQSRNVSVHIYYPGTILSPGFEEEQKVKPEVTKILEGGSPELTPKQAARALWSGVCAGRYAILSDYNGRLISARALGVDRSNNFFADFVMSLFGWIGLPVWRIMADHDARGWFRKNASD